MAVVGLEIVEPEHDTPFVGNGSATFIGGITALPEELDTVPLYYRWYSSLFPADKDRYSINGAALTDPADPFPTTLGLGTHVITLAAVDRAGETDADLEAIQHGGVTGGSDGDTQCLVHVFIANLIAPLNEADLSRALSVLEAAAPSSWGQATDTAGLYELNDLYHEVNRLRYRWEFVPVGPPAGRATIDFIPDIDEYTFDPDTDPITPRIRYAGALPAALDAAYTLNLHVEDIEGALGGDQASISVTLKL